MKLICKANVTQHYFETNVGLEECKISGYRPVELFNEEILQRSSESTIGLKAHRIFCFCVVATLVSIETMGTHDRFKRDFQYEVPFRTPKRSRQLREWLWLFCHSGKSSKPYQQISLGWAGLFLSSFTSRQWMNSWLFLPPPVLFYIHPCYRRCCLINCGVSRCIRLHITFHI